MPTLGTWLRVIGFAACVLTVYVRQIRSRLAWIQQSAVRVEAQSLCSSPAAPFGTLTGVSAAPVGQTGANSTTPGVHVRDFVAQPAAEADLGKSVAQGHPAPERSTRRALWNSRVPAS